MWIVNKYIYETSACDCYLYLLRNSIENMIFSSNKMKMKVQSGQTVEIKTCLVIEMSMEYKNFKAKKGAYKK